MRCFVAVDVTDDIKEAIAKKQGEISHLADAKLVEKENLHFTLKFLGEIEEKEVEEAKKILAELSSSFQPFTIKIEKMGVFPSPNFIRVIWLDAPRLADLQKKVFFSLPFGPPSEPKPHLTIARIRSARGLEQLKAYVEKNKEISIGQMVVEKISLKKSSLLPSGPVYENVSVFELRK